MAFEIKYDKDGNVVAQPELKNQLNAAADALDQPEPQQEAQPDQDQSVLETLDAQQPEESTPEKQPEPIQNASEKKPSAPQESWKKLREKALAAEKRAAELEAALQAAQELKAQQQPQEEEEEEISVDADALVEGKHLSKVSKHIKKLEQQLHQYQQQSSLQATELRLKTQYPDFDSVVSRDNLESLRLAYPEIASTINSSSDLYSKAVSAYTMIKKLGINGDTESFEEEKAIIHKNVSKPKPSAVLNPQQSESPMSKVNAFAKGPLTDELKAQMLREMNQYRNR
ncbi:MAG TPA: hypothetical protein VL443_06415 [Cyclobacteriaceae bacterium]|jgi:hypothetical protein|nr:hypothetical protein [Cyclobacteriaceae bacterium]